MSNKLRKKSKTKKGMRKGIDTSLNMNNLGLSYVQGMNAVVCFNTGTGRISNIVSTGLGDKIYNTPHKWNFLIAVLCHEGGDNYFTQAHVIVSEPVLFDDLGMTLAEYHYKLEQSTSPTEKIRLGWIALPKDVEFNDDRSYNLFNTLRGFSENVIGTR